jgi:DNA-binding NtrC family response regulator
MFLHQHNRDQGTEKRFSRVARERIATYAWPGNVRELHNVVHRAFVLCDGDVDVDLDSQQPDPVAAIVRTGDPRFASARAVTIAIGTSLDEAERALILATLDAVSGSKVQAAKVLGISLKTLYNRMQAYRGVGGAPNRPDRCRLVAVA